MMESVITFALAGLIFLGAVATALWKNPFDKLIGISILSAGVIPLIVTRGYLDVAIVISLVIPITTILVLLLLGREVR